MDDILRMSKVLQEPYKVFKAESGAITFRLITRDTAHWYGDISLVAKECPHDTLYEIELNYECLNLSFKKDGKEVATVDFPGSEASPEKLWLCWYNDTIRMGVVESSKHVKPYLVYEDTCSEQKPKQQIGYIRITVDQHRDIIVESCPAVLRPICHKNIQGGKLRWVKMTNDKLPIDALIGGYENEPTYIARALHGRLMCPGKYVPSKKRAFVPGGHIEHTKKVFEILCGYDALWVKCKDKFVPENVFMAGSSELNGEDVYIGRAMVGDDLVVGKVHMPDKTCHLPYRGKEIEGHTYEVLVRGDVKIYGEITIQNCLLNPLKASQPCI